MIKAPIEYQGDDLLIVQTYNELQKTAQNADYWNSEDVTLLRSNIKAHYEKEQNFRCCYCQAELLTKNGRVWDGEHIVPRSTHPQFLFEPKNLAVSCIDCNGAKSNQQTLKNKKRKTYPSKAADFEIAHPHFDDYEEHIAIFLGRFYIPKTRKGEATIKICRLLRYAYEFLEWDSQLANTETLLTLASELLSCASPSEQRHKAMEMLLTLQLQVSRSLRTTTEGQLSSPSSPSTC